MGLSVTNWVPVHCNCMLIYQLS